MQEEFKLAKSTLKKKKKKVVMCHGVFDVIHSGHIKYFEQAKMYGNYLVVSVTSDKFVNKGPLRPINTLKERMYVLQNLSIIDSVLESNERTAEKNILKIKPDIYCKGPDYQNKLKNDKNLKKEVKALSKIGGKFVTVSHKASSSSRIIRKKDLDLKIPNKELSEYVSKIRIKFKDFDTNEILKKIYRLNPLILGELIIDLYNFVEPIGKSGKESMIAYREKDNMKFIGGSALLANICSTFVKKLSYIFQTGNDYKEISFIKKKLNSNINYKYIRNNNRFTIKKLRYLDSYKKNKIIGIYKIGEKPITKNAENLTSKQIQVKMKSSDAIFLADYGHGDITKKIKSTINLYKKNLYVNIQLNSSNAGNYNLEKYKNINTLCVNESELRYGYSDKNIDLDNLAYKMISKINCKNLVITQGKFGSKFYTNKKKKFYCPAFISNPEDTIGSGDVYFILISMCLSAKLDPQISMLIASLGASYTVNQIGNEQYFNSDLLRKNLLSILG